MVDTRPFWNTLCEYQHVMRVLTALLAVMTALLAFSFVFIEPGSDAYVIAIIDVALLAIAFALIGSVSLVCARRE